MEEEDRMRGYGYVPVQELNLSGQSGEGSVENGGVEEEKGGEDDEDSGVEESKGE